jgi:hypothetical protein
VTCLLRWQPIEVAYLTHPPCRMTCRSFIVVEPAEHAPASGREAARKCTRNVRPLSIWQHNSAAFTTICLQVGWHADGGTAWWHSYESTAENWPAKSLSHNPPTRNPHRMLRLTFQRSATRVLGRRINGFPARSGVHPPLRMPSRPLHPRSGWQGGWVSRHPRCILSDFASMTVVR